jgi:hypothetical protein
VPKPDESLRYFSGVWHYVQGLRHAAEGRLGMARAELETVRAIAGEAALQDFYFSSGSTPAQLLSIGAAVLSARIASLEAQWTAAIEELETAVAMQDALPYTEPPPWYFPTREALGEVLLASSRAADAEAVYIEQLEHTPRNGWSLHGLARSLRAQGKDASAAETEALRDEVWEFADIQLAAP